MTLEWTDSVDRVGWDELSALYLAAGMGVKEPSALQTAFTNSRFRAFVFDRGRPVGAGRALADGADCSYICDVAVLPDRQGSGVGTQIINELVRRSTGHKKIILYAVPGKETFYRRIGFRRMATAMAIFENPTDATEKGYLLPD